MGNSIGDLFYPDNPKRRRRVIQLSQKLYDYMIANFRATNRLTEYLNKHVHGANFNPIHINEEETLQFNCNVLKKRIAEVQAIVEKIDKLLADELDPALYRQLTDVDLSFEERVQTANNALHIVTGVIVTAAAVAVCVAIASGGILVPVVAAIGAVATSAISTIAISLIGGLVLGAIFEAITGAIERDKLEHAIKELESACNTFIPASERYNDKIFEVLAELRLHES